MDRVREWFTLSGDTPRQRVRENPLQLAVLVLLVLIGSLVTYNALVWFMGRFLTTVVMIVLAVGVGLHLQRTLLTGA